MPLYHSLSFYMNTFGTQQLTLSDCLWLKRPTATSTHWHILKKSFIWSHHELSSETDGVNEKRKLRLGDFGAPKL